MKIAIAIFGIPRGSLITSASLIANIIHPAQDLGETHLFGHLFHKEMLHNTRSGESGTLSKEDYLRFSQFNLAIEEPERCLEKWGVEFFKQFGDIENDSFQSINNLIHQLHSLYSVTKQIEGIDPDVVIFARPDLLYHQPLRKNAIKSVSKAKNRIYLPEWQWWNGYNDRFAICGNEAFKTYGYRILEAKNYCIQNGVSLHAERLLRYALTKNKTSVRTTTMRASRVRVSNIVKQENFNPIETLGNDSRKLKIELRFCQALSAIKI